MALLLNFYLRYNLFTPTFLTILTNAIAFIMYWHMLPKVRKSFMNFDLNVDFIFTTCLHFYTLLNHIIVQTIYLKEFQFSCQTLATISRKLLFLFGIAYLRKWHVTWVTNRKKTILIPLLLRKMVLRLSALFVFQVVTALNNKLMFQNWYFNDP